MASKAVITVWACRFCFWVWPSGQGFCGTCGRSRANCSASPIPLRMRAGTWLTS
jgi:hypothetical protein